MIIHDNSYFVCEGALCYYGIFPTSLDYYVLLVESPTLDNLCLRGARLRYLKDYDKVAYMEKTSYENYYVPTVERALVDCIRYDVLTEDDLYHTVDNYWNRYQDFTELLEVARFFDCEEKVQDICNNFEKVLIDMYTED